MSSLFIGKMEITFSSSLMPANRFLIWVPLPYLLAEGAEGALVPQTGGAPADEAELCVRRSRQPAARADPDHAARRRRCR